MTQMSPKQTILAHFSLVFVERTEDAFNVRAGDIGLEAMVMRFAEEDD